MVRVFPLTLMNHTPFGPGNGNLEIRGGKVLNKHGVIRTENPLDCHLLVNNKYPLSPLVVIRNLKRMLHFRKPILVWTHEPRYCKIMQPKINRPWPLAPVHIMNIYTCDLRMSNFAFDGWAIKSPLKYIEQDTCPNLNQKQVVALMRYRRNVKKQSLVKDGRELDLIGLRQRLAIIGYRRGIVDIFGPDWPKEFSAGPTATRKKSWQDGWHSEKIEILKNYQFNICLESTNFDHYCSEKIWDAIHGGCLPIYYGAHNRIYDDFPVNSFLDVADFGNLEDVFDYLESMGQQEWCDRMNRCIEVYNSFLANDSFEAHFDRAVASTAERIKALCSTG